MLGKADPSMQNLFSKNGTQGSSFHYNVSDTPSFGTPNFSMAHIKPVFNNILSNQNPSDFNSNSAFQIDSQMSNSPSNTSTPVFCQSNIFNPTHMQSAFNSQSGFQPFVFNPSNLSEENHSKANDMTFTFQQKPQEFSKDPPPIHHSQYRNHIQVVLLDQGAPDPLSESDLPAYALEEFKAHIFTLGKIPEMEPPLSLRG